MEDFVRVRIIIVNVPLECEAEWRGAVKVSNPYDLGPRVVDFDPYLVVRFLGKILIFG